MKTKYLLTNYFLIIGLLTLLFAVTACEHEPIIPDPIGEPIDTTTTEPTDTTDTNPVDTTDTGTPCEDGVIYFEKDVLPIFLSNCAFSGCHDAATATDGVILDSYENIINTADVEPFDLDAGDLYENITEDDSDKIMPPPPNAPLTSNQIFTISQWILQGAKNLTCDESGTGGSGCNTQNITFSQNVFPIIESNCLGCHSGGAPSGNVNLTNYANIKTVAENGQLYGAISHQSGFTPMPFNLPKLPNCQIEQIKAWIDEGALNN